MRGITHGAIGWGVGVTVGLITLPFGIQTGTVAPVAGMIGGLMPDIDAPRSVIGRRFKTLSFLVSLFTKHRGFFHSPILSVILFILALYFLFLSPPNGVIFLAFSLGYLSHIVADSFTPHGIGQHRGGIRTGSLSELLVFAVTVIIDFGLTVLYNSLVTRP